MNPFTKKEWITFGIGVVAFIIILVLIRTVGYPNPSSDTSMNTSSQIPPVNGTNISTDPNVQIIDEQVGTGTTAVKGSHVYVNYTGWLSDGTEFDSSSKHNPPGPIDFTLGSSTVIQGWEVGVLGMKVGGTRRLVISPAYGYGAQGAGPIPANATLIFDVQLVNVK